MRKNDIVYAFCRSNPSDYLNAVEQDSDTPNTVLTPETLASVLSDVAEDWKESHLEQLIRNAGPDSVLQRLADAPTSTWPSLAAARLFHPTLANLKAYRAEVGAIDSDLANLLLEAGAIGTNADEAGEEHDKQEAAVALLNAGETIPEAADRIALVRSLKLGDLLPVSQVKPEASALLALLLEHGLVADEAASFIHFRDAGWVALEPAIVASPLFADLLTPDLVQGVVADLLDSPRVSHRVRRKVVTQLDQFVPEDDGAALAAAGRYALSQKLPLPLDQVRRIAATNQSKPELTLELLQRIAPAPPPDKIVDTLAQLGEPYSNLATRAKDSFDVPDDAAHRAVFESLKKARVLSEFKKRRLQALRTAKLA